MGNTKINNHKEDIPDPEDIRERYQIEDEADTLELFEDENEHREINADDPTELQYWAEEFQISSEQLKAAIIINGTKVREIKKYLSA
ncbi:DUF3606 domain-containing protein [Pedobacter aquatilis]|uniref:DUF3606 domain-containing protein n=1 Tax=Pedobacter aquatilis TaxID=351343 RepID=UPI002930DE50|nr:DUF3606 domain-containing protein [Pedobacter aquatilis]